MVKPSRGLSVYNRADHPNLARFGGAFEVVFLPQGLSVLQIGEDPSHHEIAPAHHMAWDDYLDLMHQILLVPV